MTHIKIIYVTHQAVNYINDSSRHWIVRYTHWVKFNFVQ